MTRAQFRDLPTSDLYLAVESKFSAWPAEEREKLALRAAFELCVRLQQAERALDRIDTVIRRSQGWKV